VSQPANLSQALGEWRRLAEAEGQAIRAGNWSLLADCQAALAILRGVIDQLTGEIHASTNEGLKRKTSQRSVVLELIELQRKNLATLKERRERLSVHVEHLTRTGRNLRGIQRSYAPPGPAAWSSYS
jgi:hypothetical protein